MKKILISLFFIVFVFFDFLNAEATLRVGMSPDYPPFEYIKDGDYAGVDVDILKALSQKADFKYEIVRGKFDELLTMINDGSVDMVISAMAILPERASKYDHSIPYYDSPNLYITSAGNKDIVSKENLVGKTIAVINKGSVQEALAKAIPNTKVIANESIINTMMLVKMGRADAMIIDAVNAPVVMDEKFENLSKTDKMSLDMYLSFGDNKKLEIFLIESDESNKMGIFFAKDKFKNLIKKINTALTTMRENGEMAKILESHGLKLY